MFNKFGLLDMYKKCHVILEEDSSNNKGALYLGDY